MKKCLFVAMILFVFSCTESRFMNYERYHDVVIGEMISQVKASNGLPYEVKDLGAGVQEYVFIERIPLADSREIFRRYILVVEHSKITKKYIKEEVTSQIMLHG
jgi:hypothetical protein